MKKTVCWVCWSGSGGPDLVASRLTATARCFQTRVLRLRLSSFFLPLTQPRSSVCRSVLRCVLFSHHQHVTPSSLSYFSSLGSVYVLFMSNCLISSLSTNPSRPARHFNIYHHSYSFESKSASLPSYFSLFHLFG